MAHEARLGQTDRKMSMTALDGVEILCMSLHFLLNPYNKSSTFSTLFQLISFPSRMKILLTGYSSRIGPKTRIPISKVTSKTTREGLSSKDLVTQLDRNNRTTKNDDEIIDP